MRFERLPILLIVLAWAAVAVEHQGKGVGATLLKEAAHRKLTAVDIASIRSLAMHAKYREQAFYGHFDFRPPASNPVYMFVLPKDL